MFSDVIIRSNPFQGIDVANFKLSPVALGKNEFGNAARSATTSERRAFQRFAVDAVALVRPIDTNFQASGPAFSVLVVDLSASGLKFQHSDFVGASLLAVRLRLPDVGFVTLALSVLRSQPRERGFEIAGRIIATLECPDERPAL